jgi:hypothetical protein
MCPDTATSIISVIHQNIRGFLALTRWIKFLSFSFFKLFTSPLHLFLDRPVVLIPLQFQTVILLTSFTPSILL